MRSPATGPERLGGLVHVRRLNVAPLHGHARGHPEGVAGQVLHQVEQVDAQVHHVLAAAAVVVLAVRVQLLQPPDAPAGDQRLQAVGARQVGAVKVPDGDLHARRPRRRDHAVAILQADRERFFAVHVAAGVDAGQHHLQALVQPARPHADQVQLLARQHVTVVGVAALCLRLRLRACPPDRIGIGHRHHLDAFDAAERTVQAVPEAAGSGVADGTRSVVTLSHAVPSGRHHTPRSFHARELWQMVEVTVAGVEIQTVLHDQRGDPEVVHRDRRALTAKLRE